MKTKILNNLTKKGSVNSSFLKNNNLTLEECYNIVNNNIISRCAICSENPQFKNFKSGYKETCENKECIKIHAKNKREKTNIEKYGCKNVSGNADIKKKKKDTFKKTTGCDNLTEFLIKEEKFYNSNGIAFSQTEDCKNKRNTTLLQKYGTTDTLSINNGRERGIFKCNNDKEVIEKREHTCIEKYGGKTSFSSQTIQEKIKDVIEDKYGVRNISYLQEIKDKISKINKEICTSEEMKKRRHKVDENGLTSIEKQKNTNILSGMWISDTEKTESQLYYKKVWKITNSQDLNSLENFNKRGRVDLRDDAHHLDHKFSIYEGFKQNIDPEIIGNINNLEMLPSNINISKGSKCSIDITQIVGSTNE
jgi:hypothetical protein